MESFLYHQEITISIFPSFIDRTCALDELRLHLPLLYNEKEALFGIHSDQKEHAPDVLGVYFVLDGIHPRLLVRI